MDFDPERAAAQKAAKQESFLKRNLENQQQRGSNYGVVTLNVFHPEMFKSEVITKAVRNVMLDVGNLYDVAPVPVAIGNIRTPALDGVKVPRAQIVFALQGSKVIKEEVIAVMLNSLNKDGYKAGKLANSSKVTDSLEMETSPWGTRFGYKDEVGKTQFKIKELVAMVSAKHFEDYLLSKRGKYSAGEHKGWKFKIDTGFATWHSFRSELSWLPKKKARLYGVPDRRKPKGKKAPLKFR